jgi:hypothetical protein
MEMSGKVRKGQERSGKVRKGQERSRNVRKGQEMSGKVRKCQESQLHLWNVCILVFKGSNHILLVTQDHMQSFKIVA